MPNNKKAKPNIIIAGGGGHAVMVANIVSDCYEIIGVTDVNPNNRLSKLGIPYLGDDSQIWATTNSQPPWSPLKYAVLGFAGFDNKKREEVFEHYQDMGFVFPSIISPQAIINSSENNILGGTVIFPGAIIGTGVTIKQNVVINSGAIIEHDSEIGNHVQVSPGAVICGGVKIGDRAFIGANATITQGAVVGEDYFVKAGTVYV
jgi:UDP-perosamine 4-acetyltransferase